MNTFELNVKKCQKQIASCSERLANSRRWANHYSQSTKKEEQEIYKVYCEFKKQDKKDLEEAKKGLEKAYELQDKSYINYQN